MILFTKLQFLKQAAMLRVLYALLPVALGAIYFFGWRVAVIIAVAALCGFITEWIMVSQKKGKVTYACFVTASLYALSLPPTTPFWIVAVGAIIGILFGKEAFGGFGKNIFNPAIVGRAFVYVAFPIELTSSFVPVFKGFPGGFAHWSFNTLSTLPSDLAAAGAGVADAVSSATPMLAHRDMGFTADLLQLFLGSIGAVFSHDNRTVFLAAGSAGEVSALLIIIGSAYLLITKTANWRLMLSPLIGAAAMNLLLRYVLGIEAMPGLAFSLFSGALLYSAVFMVTEPVSAPKIPRSQWIYGIFIGAMIVFLRYKSIFAGAVGFAILLGNILSPSLDLWIKRIRASRTALKKAAV
ncbi:MAG: RnfABCDGE type electron transport complex subunit D [Chitinispirillaceae bacterium]|nr:RnfABCDGE type electron transport complex subunit D [Chitinispirillaceae bacterium]